MIACIDILVRSQKAGICQWTVFLADDWGEVPGPLKSAVKNPFSFHGPRANVLGRWHALLWQNSVPWAKCWRHHEKLHWQQAPIVLGNDQGNIRNKGTRNKTDNKCFNWAIIDTAEAKATPRPYLTCFSRQCKPAHSQHMPLVPVWHHCFPYSWCPFNPPPRCAVVVSPRTSLVQWELFH